MISLSGWVFMKSVDPTHVYCQLRIVGRNSLPTFVQRNHIA